MTEWMKKFGPEDISYCCSWRPEDINALRLFVAVEKAYLDMDNTRLALHFVEQCERRLNDHKAELVIPGFKIPIIECSKAVDLPSIQGLSYFCKGMMTTFTKPRWMGVGNDPREARAYHSKLYGELGTRADMNNAPEGSITRVNQSLKFIGIFPASFPTITVVEAAVYNVLSGYTSGTQFNRIVFVDFPIAHTSGALPFTVSIMENFAPVTQWG